MSRTPSTHLIEAIYEEGHLRPLQPLPLAEGEHVRIGLTSSPEDAARKIEAVETLLTSCSEMTSEQWTVFDEASARRRLFFRRETDS